MNARKALALITLILGSTGAHAVPIVLSDSAPQTTAGEDFQFDFAAPLSDGSDGLFTFLARGDYTIGASLGESVDLGLDMLLSFNDLQATAANVITSFTSDDNLWEIFFVIPGADMVAMTSDGSLSIFIDIAGGVGLNLATAFVDVTLEYEAVNAVSEPGTLGLLGIGLIALGLMRRRRKTI